MKHRLIYLLASFFIIFYGGASLFYAPVAEASGEKYVFHYQKGQETATEKALNAIAGQTSVLQYTYVKATGGVFGSQGIRLDYQAGGPTDVADGSVLTSDFSHFFVGNGSSGSYKCDGYTINTALLVKPPINLSDGLKFQTWITSASSVAYQLNGDSGTTVQPSAVPAHCRPAGAGLADVPTSHPATHTAKAIGDVVPPTFSNPGSDDCESSGGGFSLNWALCVAYQGTQAVVNWMFANIISPLLSTTPICLPGSGCDPTVYQIWSNFRIYGDIFLAIVLLVIVFGESIGGGLIEAYTVKKVLPRVLAAAILLNISIYLMAFMIDMTNIVGQGIGSLLTAPLHGHGLFTIEPGNITAGAIFGTAVGAGLLAGAFAINVTGIALLLLGLAITGAIAVLGVFFTLIIRQAIIYGLVLVSPVAFALWCLPNTERWFKKWWETFFQMLLVYPMIVVMFAVADVMSYLTAHNGNGGSYVNNIIAFMLLLIPLFLVPFTLRSSNRIMGAIGGAMANVGKQINAISGRRLIGAAGQEFGKTFSHAMSEDRFRGAEEGSLGHRLNRSIARVANIGAIGRSGLRPRNIRDDLNAAVIAQKNIARHKKAEDSSAFQTFAGNDDMLESAMLLYHEGEQAARDRLTAGGLTGQAQDTALAQIRAAQRQMGAQNLALTAAVANAGTGTGYAEGAGQLYDSIISAAGGDMMVAGSAYAEARGNLEKARRFDALESFGSAMQHMAAINASAPGAARDAAIQRANQEGADVALEIQGMGAVMHGRGQSARNFGPAIQRRLQNATQAYNDALANGSVTIQRHNADTGQMENVTLTPEEAERNWVQVMASTSAAVDNAGSASPEIQRLMADTVHNGMVDVTQLPNEIRDMVAANPDGTRTTAAQLPVSTVMERLEGMEAFRQMKKVYAQRYQQDAAAQMAGNNPAQINPNNPNIP